MKLNLGCGNLKIDGFIGVDFRKTNITDMIMDLSRPLNFESNSIDEIYCCHVIEHLTKNRAIDLVKEINRILKPNAILHLHLPLIDYYKGI